MSKAVLVWAIVATLLAGFFLWRYEKKACIENKVINHIDTAVVYIPMNGGYTDNSGNPGLKLPKFPAFVESGKQKRFVIMPQVTLGLNDRMGGTSFGITGMYLRDRWSYSYTYDFMLQSHTIGIGWRF